MGNVQAIEEGESGTEKEGFWGDRGHLLSLHDLMPIRGWHWEEAVTPQG